ncbi:hypothetical protein C3941_00125 [Kaistia algarum]|nr:hypothetical protein C3941_00125 [Kaistia algarum]
MPEIIFEEPSPAAAAVQREVFIDRMAEHLIATDTDPSDRDAVLRTLKAGTYPVHVIDPLSGEAAQEAIRRRLPAV